MDADTVVLMAAQASRLENQDAIDAAIVGMLADPREARAGVREVHFLPFNPTDKRTALTYIDSDGKMHRVSKGAPEQVSLTVIPFLLPSFLNSKLTMLLPMMFSDPKSSAQ